MSLIQVSVMEALARRREKEKEKQKHLRLFYKTCALTVHADSKFSSKEFLKVHSFLKNKHISDDEKEAFLSSIEHGVTGVDKRNL